MIMIFIYSSDQHLHLSLIGNDILLLMFIVEDDEKQEKNLEIDPEVASTDSPDSSGSSFSGYTAQTVTWCLQEEFKLLILNWNLQQRSFQVIVVS